jgi:predicted nucleotidyltransferase component of viral defense system
MQELQYLEIFEIETLEILNRFRILDKLHFGGGTMLRLCHNLNRYSTDLDFWIEPIDDHHPFYKKVYEVLSKIFTIKDAKEKRNTLLFEIHSSKSLRNLFVEIRNDQTGFHWERKIAFSKFTTLQITVKGLTLEQMLLNKIDTLLSRKLIRDCFDIEFLLFRGISLPENDNKLTDMLNIIQNFNDRDYKVILGSVLDEKDRMFCLENRFQFLREEIGKRIR